MRIPVKIVKGCKVIILPDPNTYSFHNGVVEKITGKESFDVSIKGATRNIHIFQILQFTFGGVWMVNHQCPGRYNPFKIRY